MTFFGAFFFVSEERRELKREVFTIGDLVSKIGGFLSLFQFVFFLLGKYINIMAIMGAIVERLYFYTSDGKKV